jgi:hypothetical protein
MKMNDEKLIMVVGGVSLTGTLINAMSRAINALLEVGRSLGTAIRRITNKNLCRLN